MRDMARPHQLLLCAPALLLASCGEPGDGNRAFDGGRPIDRHPALAGFPDPREQSHCWRRERGGWHSSIVHCARMTSPEHMTGVWITGFEELSFVRGATAMPDRNDPQRYRSELEIDSTEVRRLIGREFDPGYNAIAVTFIGRRTLYPNYIDCYGRRSYTYTVDRLDSARYLGLIADADPPPLPTQQPLPHFTPSGEGGEIGRLEAQAAAFCNH